MSYTNSGKVWTPSTLRAELVGVKRPTWIQGITLHHTAAPSLAQRPNGFTAQHMANLAAYYKGLGWSAGPHFFTDDDQIHGLSPYTQKGTHARSFNATHIGIEALGDYDSEWPNYGRGLAVWRTTGQLVAVLLEWLGLDAGAVNCHRDDPQTSKTCPGARVEKEWLRTLILLPEADQAARPEEIFDGEFVRVADYLPGAKLQRVGKDTFVDGHRLEKWEYRDGATWALASELAKI